MSTEHAKKAAIFNKNREKTTWHDQTFWSVRMKHDAVAHQLPEWEDLRQHASDIKRHTITHLADYLEAFTSNLESRGVIVHWASEENGEIKVNAHGRMPDESLSHRPWNRCC